MRFVPFNGKIADINHEDTNKHFLDLERVLSERRKIVAVILHGRRLIGTGVLRVYPNEGKDYDLISNYGPETTVIIADGTQRLQYYQTLGGDSFELYCYGYIVTSWPPNPWLVGISAVVLTAGIWWASTR